MAAPGKIAQDRALLLELEEAIPALEERLRAMKVTRKRLRASEQMRAQRRDRAFNAATEAGQRVWQASPEGRAMWVKNLRHQAPKASP